VSSWNFDDFKRETFPLFAVFTKNSRKVYTFTHLEIFANIPGNRFHRGRPSMHFSALAAGRRCDIIHLDERRKKSSGRSGARVFDKTFKALSDPTRRQILELLRRGPKSAGEISEQFGTSGATISHHLSVLKDAGLVSDEKRGKYIFYELDTSVLQDMLAWVAGFAKGDGDETKQ
jgi:ArsR family transcriptional regulator